jgi:misacylated tRNA(Ala) deacylase
MTQPDNNNNSNGRVVGDLTCQSDSYLKSLDTKVISCEKAPKQAHKSKKHNGHAQDEWLIECSDSVLFPEGELLHFRSLWCVL